MAGLAFSADPSLMMRILMTIAADFGRLGELLGNVTAFARHSSVQTDEREFGQVVVEGNRLAPAIIVVAALARGAKLALMGILLLVARNARHGQLVFVEIALVASLAGHFDVRAVQRKLGRLVVIEAYRLPFFAVVARFAFGAVAAVVNVADAVTIDARSADTLPALVSVASGARDFDVRANEGEFRFAVIECVGGFPGGDAVAAVAGFA